MTRPAMDLTGQRFGALTAKAFVRTTTVKRRLWLCDCDCGQPAEATVQDLRGGRAKSCGCRINRGACQPTHRQSETVEYGAWRHMIHRCENPNNPRYRDYGGRGIAVCPEWRASFVAFFSHVGPRPAPEFSIDRIDNDRGYEPGNVRWATRSQQQRNKRRRTS